MAKCLKCGVNIADGHTFCDSCIAEMEKHPIAPGTPVMILKRPSKNPKTGRKKRQTQADTIRKLYKQIRGLGYLCGFFGLLVIVLAALLIWQVYF